MTPAQGAPQCRVRPVTRADVDFIAKFLEDNMGRGIPASEYRRIFDYPWKKDDSQLGFVLIDGERIVGFLGALYAEREINGRKELFCNPSNWCVLKEYRHSSLALFLKITSCGDCTVTELSPIESVETLCRQLKYQTLDTFKLFSVPMGHAWTLFRFPRPKVITDLRAIAGLLPPLERKIFDDHQGTKCGYLLLREGAESCFVVWSRRVRKGLPFSEILYRSNAQLLRKHFETVKLAIMRHDLTFLVAIDERLIGERLPGMLPYRRVSMFKSKRLTPADIDNLYSELTVL
jgi:acetoacetyl-CoA synthetase